ncbi:MAG: hypothetical protein M3O15_14815, partial [Acidobacteriota bacterium]|nr:hypothetical protein [Acidobacteriota bacterium]
MRLRHLLLATLLGLLPALAFAGDQANAPTATGETGLFTLKTGDTLPAGRWSVGLYYNNWDPVYKNPNGPDVHLDWSREDLSVGYGITDWWELSVAGTYDEYRYSRSDKNGVIILPFDDSPHDGAGNVHIGTKFRFLGARGDANTGALGFFVEPSTGRTNFAPSKTGYGADLDFRFAGSWVASIGYQKNTHAFSGVNFDSETTAGLGWAPRVSDNLDWITEVAYSHFGNVGYKNRYDFTTGGRLWFGPSDNFALNFGVRVDLAQLNQFSDHCPLGGVFGFSYFPRTVVAKEVPPPPPPPPAP